MKKVILLSAVTLAGLLSINAAQAPVAPQTQAQPAQVTPRSQMQAGIAGAIKVVTPQKDLETAIRVAKEGDILVYSGQDSWYHIDGKSLHGGTRVFVLGQGSLVSVFPKEADSDSSVR